MHKMLTYSKTVVIIISMILFTSNSFGCKLDTIDSFRVRSNRDIKKLNRKLKHNFIRYISIDDFYYKGLPISDYNEILKLNKLFCVLIKNKDKFNVLYIETNKIQPEYKKIVELDLVYFTLSTEVSETKNIYPDWINNLTKLKYLNLYLGPYDEIGEVLFDSLQNVKELQIAIHRGFNYKFVRSIGKLKNLEDLFLSSDDSLSLDTALFSLSKLETLNIGWNNIRLENLIKLKQVRYLYIHMLDSNLILNLDKLCHLNSILVNVYDIKMINFLKSTSLSCNPVLYIITNPTTQTTLKIDANSLNK